MNEKVYRTMSITGAADLAAGIITIVVGVTVGVIAIINGSRLLSERKNILL